MGVPKFFRWLSERYPKIIQRYGVETDDALLEQHGITPSSSKEDASAIPQPDPLSTCGLPPVIDRLYIDMNGIIHGCSHNNSESSDDNSFSEEAIFGNMCLYLDRVMHSVQPTQLVYMAIDGVAPRAKLNQQRARRYRSGQEGEIERTIYDAHMESLQQQQEQQERDDIQFNRNMDEDDEGEGELWFHSDSSDVDSSGDDEESSILKRKGKDGGDLVQQDDGRITGKFQAGTGSSSSSSRNSTSDSAATAAAAAGKEDTTTATTGTISSAADNDSFTSNVITPGTPFFTACTQHLQHFIQLKLSTDPVWQKLDIVFSGPNVPGEGEHKIMQFLREQKQQESSYDPNLRHCIMGQDGDLIMLGLVTHEPNLMLLREKVYFVSKDRDKYSTLDSYVRNGQFEFLHMNVLRDYLALEFETSNIWPASRFDLERTIDDFVFLTFLVGNDFLPHMPALDIGDEAFDLMFYAYRSEREKWPMGQYLTHEGDICCGQRLESFLQVVGAHETNFFQYKRSNTDYDKNRTMEAKFGNVTTPSDVIMQSKEESDRESFRNRVLKFQDVVDNNNNNRVVSETNNDSNSEGVMKNFLPVLSGSSAPPPPPPPSRTSKQDDAEQQEGLFAKMGRLLQFSSSSGGGNAKNDNNNKAVLDDTDVKGRYYSDKFGFSPFDAESHIALRQAYVEGLVWNLKYYYTGCVSWDWYYPYHYGPMISDLVDLDNLLHNVKFEMGTPLLPFEQLMACLPPSHSHLLPEPYRPLMTDESSPIAEFYPSAFTVDMNGKRWPWEAVVLLPFIDSKRLLNATNNVDQNALSSVEKKRNKVGNAVVWSNSFQRSKLLPAIGNGANFGEINNTAKATPFDKTKWAVPREKLEECRFRSKLEKNVQVPLDGLPTLRDGSIQSMWRKRVFVDVHGNRSRYTTAFLQMHNTTENLPALQLAPRLIGTIVYINYPSLIEAFVTAVSDANVFVRGNDEPRPWTSAEATARKKRVRKLVNSYAVGEGLTGTGGFSMSPNGDTLFHNEDQDTLLNVRPLKGIDTVNGKTVKKFADFEVEVPLFVKSWVPVAEDRRLKNAPALLEKNAYHHGAKKILAIKSGSRPPTHKSKRNKRSSSIPAADDKVAEQMTANFARRQSRAMSTSASSLGDTSGFKHNLNSGFRRQPHRRMTTHSPVSNFKQSCRPHAGSCRGRLIGMGVIAAATLFSSSHAIDPVSRDLSQARGVSYPSFLKKVESHRADMVPTVAKPPLLEFAHGTTTLSFIFQGGIIAAVDSRASLGSFVGSKTTQKVLPINSHILGTMAGGAADCMFWIRKIQAESGLHLLQEGYRISVARASRLLSNALYENRNADLSIGTMIMGFDDSASGSPKIFYVDNTGTRIEGECFSIGSGSTYALGILDTERRYDMSTNEAIALGIKAIRHATFRDAYSGGFINCFLITREDGWVRVHSEDLAIRE